MRESDRKQQKSPERKKDVTTGQNALLLTLYFLPLFCHLFCLSRFLFNSLFHFWQLPVLPHLSISLSSWLYPALNVGHPVWKLLSLSPYIHSSFFSPPLSLSPSSAGAARLGFVPAAGQLPWLDPTADCGSLCRLRTVSRPGCDYVLKGESEITTASAVAAHRWRLSTDKPGGSATVGVFLEEVWETFGIAPAFSLHHPIKRARKAVEHHIFVASKILYTGPNSFFPFLIFVGPRSCRVEHIPFEMMILPKIFERTFSARKEIPESSAWKSRFSGSSSDRAKNAVLPCVCSLLISSLPKNMGVERGR